MGLQPIHLHERPVFYLSMVLFLLGSQMIGVGLLAELVVANSGNKTLPYSIAAKTGLLGSDKIASLDEQIDQVGIPL